MDFVVGFLDGGGAGRVEGEEGRGRFLGDDASVWSMLKSRKWVRDGIRRTL